MATEYDSRPKLNDWHECCERLAIGHTTFKMLIRTGALRCIRIGRSVRVTDAELKRFIAEREGRNAA